MGCRHNFVVDRLEDLVDEGGSRSSWRAHEHENFWLASLLNVAIHILWSRCPLRWSLWRNRLVVQSQQVSPFYHDLHLDLHWCSFNHERNVYRFPEHSNGTRFLSQRVSPFYRDLDLGLVGSVGCLLLVEQLLNPIRSSSHVSRKIFGGGRSDAYTFRE